MEALTSEQITAILSQTRNRGGHERNIRQFIESGNMYEIVSERPEYKTKDATVLKNTLTQVAKKAQLGSVRFVKHEGGVLMINTSLLANEDSE